MNISTANIKNTTGIMPTKLNNTGKFYNKVVAKDSFEPTTDVPIATTYNATSFALKPNRFNNISFHGATASKINKVTRLEETPVNVVQRFDGGYLIDNETKTIAYYGEDAIRYLKDATNFTKDTQIIAQSGCDYTVKTLNGKEIHLDEPGAIMINKGTMAEVKINKGNPLVITTEKKPHWYKQFNETNHKDYFDYLTEKNKHLYSNDIPKRAIEKNYALLKENEIIKDTKDEEYIKFNVKNAEELEAKLLHLNMTLDEKVKLTRIFQRTQEKYKSSIQTPGELSNTDKKHLNTNIIQTLLFKDILKYGENKQLTWKKFETKDELINELKTKTRLTKEDKCKIIKTWENSTKSGYDITGLKDSADGVAVYVHSGKINPYNYSATDWITNSTAWTPKGAMTIGVSRVTYGNKRTGVRAFNKCRPEECIHKHQNPNNPNEKMTESYILTQGKAAIYTEKNNKAKIEILKAGDMYVIPSGVKHGIIAIDGEYEHLCFQTPSSFQYGFKFKSEQMPFPPKIVNGAEKMLNSHHNISDETDLHKNLTEIIQEN